MREKYSFLPSGCSRGHAYSVCQGKNKRMKSLYWSPQEKRHRDFYRGVCFLFLLFPRCSCRQLNERFYFVAEKEINNQSKQFTVERSAEAIGNHDFTENSYRTWTLALTRHAENKLALRKFWRYDFTHRRSKLSMNEKTLRPSLGYEAYSLTT